MRWNKRCRGYITLSLNNLNSHFTSLFAGNCEAHLNVFLVVKPDIQTERLDYVKLIYTNISLVGSSNAQTSSTLFSMYKTNGDKDRKEQV